MDKLKMVKEQLMALVETQLGDIKSVDAKEFGEVIDMIKDLAEASYYCTVTEAMEKGTKHKEHYDYDTEYDRRYYPRRRHEHDDWDREPYYRDNDYREKYRDYEYPRDITRRDPKEGRSPLSRKMYMEAKELHRDTPRKMEELEHYIQELTSDLVEMIADATPEEKQLLKTKISTLSSKIN